MMHNAQEMKALKHSTVNTLVMSLLSPHMHTQGCTEENLVTTLQLGMHTQGFCTQF